MGCGSLTVPEVCLHPAEASPGRLSPHPLVPTAGGCALLSPPQAGASVSGPPHVLGLRLHPCPRYPRGPANLPGWELSGVDGETVSWEQPRPAHYDPQRHTHTHPSGRLEQEDRPGRRRVSLSSLGGCPGPAALAGPLLHAPVPSHQGNSCSHSWILKRCVHFMLRAEGDSARRGGRAWLGGAGTLQQVPGCSNQPEGETEPQGGGRG